MTIRLKGTLIKLEQGSFNNAIFELPLLSRKPEIGDEVLIKAKVNNLAETGIYVDSLCLAEDIISFLPKVELPEKFIHEHVTPFPKESCGGCKINQLIDYLKWKESHDKDL